MAKMVLRKIGGSGLRAPARLLVAALIGAAIPAQPVAAQQPPPVAAVPVPDALELSKLVWSTMAAIDHANRSGNYSVLRDLGAPGFQVNNDAARLAQVFAGIRSENIDLSNCLLLAPVFRGAPRIIQPGVMQILGTFGLRPIAINFELYYQWSGGRWRLFGVDIQPQRLATMQPGSGPAAPPRGQPAAVPPPKKR